MPKVLFILPIFCLIGACTLNSNSSNNPIPTDTHSKKEQTLYYGGDIITMEGDTPTYVEAVVEREGKIVYVGNKANAIKQLEDNTNEVDLKGKTMLPAFLDPHGHFMSAIMMVNQVNIASPPVGTTQTIPQIIEKLKAYQQNNKIVDGDWIVGWGYDQELLDEKRHVTKLDLDTAFPHHKVMLIHVSMHGAVLNSKALEWAGINKNSATPAGGVIARLEGSNEPAGLLMEMAYIPVFEKLPQPSNEEMLALMKPAQMMYASEGYTQAIEGFTHTKHLDFLLEASRKNKIFLDLIALPAFTEMNTWLNNPKYKFGEYSNHFKIQACKITLDGSPQGKTALVSKPYLTNGPAGEKDWYGNASINQAQLDTMTKKMFDNNIPLHIHGNGDGAIDMIIKSVENAGITAKDDRRTVIVHSQFQRPEHLPKYVELGLVPSYFTLHTYFWGDVHVKNIGKEAADFISPMKAAKEAGLATSNHSDFNVTPLNPFLIMWSAMARESRSGQIIGADQQVDAYTALQALTTGPAYEFFEEHRKGAIKTGLLADFVIIEKNPLKQSVKDIRNNDVLETIKEGKTIYKK